ncbi:MAG: hypothetical protein WC869_00370 [Phycisphaerae bacterium]|jgi:hypothetical protein
MKAIFWIGKVGFFGTLVRLFKRDGISHSALLFSDGFCGTSQPGRGIVLYKLAPFNTADWFIIDLPCTPEEEARVRSFFEVDEAGCKYDWRGIAFCQVLRWGWHSNTRWFCSEACLAALQRIYTALQGLKPWYVDPADLATVLDERVVPLNRTATRVG